MKVLIVEDNTLTRENLKTYLEHQDIEVDEAGMSLVAFSLIETTKYDCILIDLGLPDLDGIQLIKKIRNTGCRCKIIVTSGHDERDILFKCVSAGANHYLIKPIDYNRLKDLIFDV